MGPRQHRPQTWSWGIAPHEDGQASVLRAGRIFFGDLAPERGRLKKDELVVVVAREELRLSFLNLRLFGLLVCYSTLVPKRGRGRFDRIRCVGVAVDRRRYSQ